MFVEQTRFSRGFMRNGRQAGRMIILLQATLNDFDFDIIVRLIPHVHDPIKTCTAESFFIHISQEIQNSAWSQLWIQLKLNTAKVCFEQNGGDFSHYDYAMSLCRK
jgi:ketopantoate reductase